MFYFRCCRYINNYSVIQLPTLSCTLTHEDCSKDSHKEMCNSSNVTFVQPLPLFTSSCPNNLTLKLPYSDPHAILFEVSNMLLVKRWKSTKLFHIPWTCMYVYCVDSPLFYNKLVSICYKNEEIARKYGYPLFQSRHPLVTRGLSSAQTLSMEQVEPCPPRVKWDLSPILVCLKNVLFYADEQQRGCSSFLMLWHR